MSALVRKGGATKCFKEFCDKQQKIKHYHYRYLGKLKTSNGKHNQPANQKGFDAVSKHLQSRVYELQAENRKLKIKVGIMKEMLMDEWTKA